MVSKLFKMLNRESAGINEAALLLGLFTFVSQILGLVRDRLLATYLGAGPALDIYYAAFKIPDFLYVSVATLAAITVLLPYLSERYGSGDTDGVVRAKTFLNQVFSALLIFLVGISIILFIAMPWLAKLIAPGFDAASLHILTMLSRIMLIQPILIGISNMLSSVTQMFRKFFVTALSPVFYNIGIIIGILVFYPMFGALGLAYGVVLGAILHLGSQIPVLYAQGFMPKFTIRISFSELQSIVLTSIPRTIGLSMSAFTALILTSIASTLGTGSISIFNLTNNMLNVPIGIVGISYSVASFPVLIKFFQTNERVKFSEYILNATRKIILWAVPITVLFIVLRAQIVRVILGTNSFSWNDTRLAAACLGLFVIGLVAQCLTHLFVRGFYAAGNTKKPLMTNFFSQATVVVLVILFLVLFRQVPGWTDFFATLLRLDGVPNISILALPLGFSLGNILNAVLLGFIFRRNFPASGAHNVIVTTMQTIGASFCMGVATYGMLQVLAPIINQNTFWGIFGQGLIAGLVGIVIFITIMTIMKNRDMAEFMASLHRKFWKVNVVVDQTGIDN